MQEAETRTLGIDQKRELQGNQTPQKQQRNQISERKHAENPDRERRYAVYNPEEQRRKIAEVHDERKENIIQKLSFSYFVVIEKPSIVIRKPSVFLLSSAKKKDHRLDLLPLISFLNCSKISSCSLTVQRWGLGATKEWGLPLNVLNLLYLGR